MSDLDLLPDSLRAQSRMEREIALPYPEVLEAIDTIERQGVFLLGWEALATWPDGGFGAYPGGVVTHFSVAAARPEDDWSEAVAKAAAAVRETITYEATNREGTAPMAGVELIFCITCDDDRGPSGRTASMAP